MPTSNNNSKALNGVIHELEKRYGKGTIMSLDGSVSIAADAIPSGSIALDEALGIGGYPSGRIVEIFGPESSGKTTLCLHAIAETQKAGGTAAFIDAEHAFDAGYAAALGVQLPELLLSQPDSGEQGLEIAESLARCGEVDLVVVDSVAALTPQAEIDGQMGDSHMGLQARLMSQALRKLTGVCHRSGTTLIFINQLRQKIGVVFGNPETTPGGNALKFYASLRLDIRRIGQIKTSTGAVGSRTRVKVVKNKCAPPFQVAEFDIRWGVGVDRIAELLDCACDHGIVEKRGAYFAFAGETIGQGRERVRQAILDDPELEQSLRQAVNAQANDSAPESSETPLAPVEAVA